MTKRHNHYEAAFEALLQRRGVPYVAVDESRRARLAHTAGRVDSLKSLDFIVSGRGGRSWLVDVKGRRFPAGQRRQYWKNWSTSDDLLSLARWQTLFGSASQAALVFAYAVDGPLAPLPQEQLWNFRGHWYAFVALGLEQYLAWARPISRRWQTWAMSPPKFRALAVPFESLVTETPARPAAAWQPVSGFEQALRGPRPAWPTAPAGR